MTYILKPIPMKDRVSMILLAWGELMLKTVRLLLLMK